MSTAWPTVVERLVAMFRATTTAAVYDGPPVTSGADPDYVTVGYVDDEDAGDFSTEAIFDGSQSRETGTVRCQIVSQGGDTDLVARRTRAFAIEAALRAAIQADHTLGVLSPDGTSSASTDVQSVQNPNGSAQRLVVTVSYSTRY